MISCAIYLSVLIEVNIPFVALPPLSITANGSTN